jgi:hypothetical protein
VLSDPLNPSLSWELNKPGKVRDEEKTTKRSPGTQTPYQKGYLCRQGLICFDKQTQVVDSFSKPGVAEKSTGYKYLPVVRKLLIKDVSQGNSNPGLPPQGHSSSRKPVEEWNYNYLLTR